MAEGKGFLDGFRREMQQAGSDIADDQVAARLGDHLTADDRRFGSQIAELTAWGFNVEFKLKNGEWWNVECVGADAYHFYQAHVRDDGAIVWPNIWVAGDLSLDETIRQIRDAVLNGSRSDA